MRWIFVLVCACATTPPSPPARQPEPAGICTGLTDDACQQLVLDQSICMVSPDQPPCRPLRRRGLLPPPPPSVDELAGCYTSADDLDGKLKTTVCFERERVAIFDGAWDEVAVAAWHRDDTPHRAIWVVDTTDGVSRWVAPEGHGQIRVASDGGRWNVRLVRAHTSVPPEVDVEATCKAFHDCEAELAELARRRAPPPPPNAAEIDMSVDDGYHNANPKSLRACALELETIVQRAGLTPLPAACHVP